MADEKAFNSTVEKQITFTLLGTQFHPVFTHQIFATEHSIRSNARIQVDLSPSCQECSLTIDEADEVKTMEPDTKRSKLSYQESIELGDTDTDTDDDDEDDDIDGGDVRLTPQELGRLLEKFLPRKVPSSSSDNVFLSSPKGKIVTEYTTKVGQSFCISLCDGHECVDYHTSVQKLAYYFIETAEEVDVSILGPTSWKCLYLFHKHGENNYSLAGYFTLYHFNSPFRKPSGGVVVRVCQALVLPPYQRSGHGKRMLHAVFDSAAGSSSVVEINCEDPAPSFAKLRIVVDYDRFKKQGSKWFGRKQDVTEVAASFFDPLSDAAAQQLTRDALTTSKQIQIVHELDTLRCLRDHFSLTDCQDRDDLEKRYRLMVKQRLHRQHREELSACNDKTERQDLLAELFDTSYGQYAAILSNHNSPANDTLIDSSR